MSVAIFNIAQFRRMAAVLFATTPRRAENKTPDPVTIKAVAEVFARASAANHKAFAATYGDRHRGYLASMGAEAGPLAVADLAQAFAEPVASLEPALTRLDAELLIYNTIDNHGGEHLDPHERLGDERIVALIIEACDRLERTGQCGPMRLRVIAGG